MKTNNSSLIGKSLTQLENICEDYGYESYRGQQLFNWIYKNNITDYESFNNIPKDLNDKLISDFVIHPLEFINSTKSVSKQTEKILFKTQNGDFIESVLMNDGSRITLCVSTQVGCALDCKFCATAKMGFITNLDAGQIVDQFLQANVRSDRDITNIVFMGMGEPLLNYKNVIEAASLLNHPDGISLGYSRITISTAGIVNKIKKFIDERHKYNLAISLNGTTNTKRLEIMPVTKNNSLSDLLDVSKEYVKRMNKWLTFEYVLIKNQNDNLTDAKNLIKIVKSIRKVKLNIIPYNEIDEKFKRPEENRIKQFLSMFKNVHFPVTVRWSKGTDIDAGCGQLVIRELIKN